MRKTAIFLLGTLLFAGCSIQNNIQTTTTDSEIIESSSRQGDTTLSGTVSQAGEKFFINGADGKPQEIDSYSYDLSEYNGKNVEITGQFSGDTLFAGSIKEVVEEE